MFVEKPHQHWRNRRDAHNAIVQPATLADGALGVHIRIGGLFTVLSAEEFTSIATRALEALDTTTTEGRDQ